MLFYRAGISFKSVFGNVVVAVHANDIIAARDSCARLSCRDQAAVRFVNDLYALVGRRKLVACSAA